VPPVPPAGVVVCDSQAPSAKVSSAIEVALRIVIMNTLRQAAAVFARFRLTFFLGRYPRR
jgi:hypothetical protein